MVSVRHAEDMVAWAPAHVAVLKQVTAERLNQIKRYGFNRDLELGMGPDVRWLAGTDVNLDLRTADEIEEAFRAEYEQHKRKAANGKPTWMHLIREEVGEAFKEDDLANLETELIQVAALCVSLVETLHRNAEQAELEGTGE